MINPDYPWPSYIKLTKSGKGKRIRYIITFNGEQYTSLAKFAAFLGASTTSIYDKSLSCKNEKEFRKFLKNLIIHARYRVPFAEKVYMRGKDCVNFLSAIREEFPGITDSYLRTRLLKWEKGEIDCDKLYQPIKKFDHEKIHTFNKPKSKEDIRRLESIKDIPGPTDIERKLWNL